MSFHLNSDSGGPLWVDTVDKVSTRPGWPAFAAAGLSWVVLGDSDSMDEAPAEDPMEKSEDSE